MIRIVLPLAILLAPFAYGEVTFSNLDLAPDNVLLFQAHTDAPTYGRYTTLFRANLVDKSLTQLSFFPEQIMLVANRSELQIRNRFGVFRSDPSFRDMKPVANFPAFVTGHDIQSGKIATASASPDGRYLLYLEPQDFGHADLVLYTIANGSTFTVASRVPYQVNRPPALWSSDSTHFVYASGGTVYYFSIEQLLQNRVADPSLREIGPGTISNVEWGADGNLYYLNGSLVYRITTSDLFTRSLYRSLIGIGTIIGKIPFTFDGSFDAYWIGPGGTRILLDKGGRNLFLYTLRGDDYTTAGQSTTLPYLLLPRNTRVQEVLWSNGGIVTLLTASIVGKALESSVYRMNLYSGGEPAFVKTADSGIRSIVLSADGSQALLLEADRVVLRDYRSWQDIRSFLEPDPLHALWVSSFEFVVAGGSFTELVNIAKSSQTLVCLSQAGRYGFDATTGKIEASSEGRTYELSTGIASGVDPAPGPGAEPAGVAWTPASSFNPAPARVASDLYRVFVETAESSLYADMVMVRDVQGEGTQPLFSYPKGRLEPFPKVDQPVNFTDFTHGSRIHRREVALVFNATDSVEGLTTVLDTLREYDLRCTFFVNGEFMRRNPEATKELADSGQEIGSLFFANFDMTDARYNVDSAFVKQGLARNEDLYYALTGKELSLLWHAPFYVTSSRIIDAASQMNYTYVGRDVDPLDWVSKNDALHGVNIYLSTSDIIDRIMKLKEPGSIIPIQLGAISGGRNDYLWSRLDVLINDLESLGYRIVPVSTLMEDAR